VKVDSPRYLRNLETMRRWWPECARRRRRFAKGAGAGRGGAAQEGRLTARERIGLLLDEGTELFELGLHAAHGMYEDGAGLRRRGGDRAGAVHGRSLC